MTIDIGSVALGISIVALTIAAWNLATIRNPNRTVRANMRKLPGAYVPQKAFQITMRMHDQTLRTFFRKNPDQEFTLAEIQGRCEIYDDPEFGMALAKLCDEGFVVSRPGEFRERSWLYRLNPDAFVNKG